MAEGEDMLAEALRHGAPPADRVLRRRTRSARRPAAGRAADARGGWRVATARSRGAGSARVGLARDRRLAPALGREACGDRSRVATAVVVYLHDVADPGNVGTVLRAAYAFGAGGVVLSARTADPFGPKAVRASMGAVFAVPVARASLAEARAALGAVPGGRAGARRRGAPLRGSTSAGPRCSCWGPSAPGCRRRSWSSCDEVAHVPLAPGGAESLNVAMTATLCLYEAPFIDCRRTDG